ncbi:MAG: pre-peptidase C-terminal domain-containing protein [Holophagales bacterium]|nr:pre-peptidase C-terminal domain-containing protein [Holophagales bacterium]
MSHWRWSRAFAVVFSGLLMVSSATAFAQASAGRVPTLAEQLKKAGARPGTAFEQLIKENQDFSVLRADEKGDTGRVPPWLKVIWRKANPDGHYTADDPTGGYPFVLKEVVEWMQSHQDLRPGLPDANFEAGYQNPPDGIGEWDRESENYRVSALATSIGTNYRISGAQSSARSESDIRINYWNPNQIIGASNNISGSGFQAQFYSLDGGTTWGQTTLPAYSTDAFNSDPTVDWTSDGTAWSSTMGINSAGTVLMVRMFKSTDQGRTWTFDGTISGTQTNTDKQMVWVDHSATSPYKDNIYAIWHNGNPVYMNRRNSTGWLSSPIQVSGSQTTGTGIGSDVKTNSYGDVFGMWPDTGSRGLYVAKSTNGGTSYGTPVKLATTYDSYDIGVPAFNGRRILIYVTAGAYRTASKDMVYAVWTDLSGETGCTAAASEPGSSTTSACKTRIWFAKSANGGTTWGTPVKINNQAGKNDQFNPWLVVDETNGAIGVMYYDTVNDTTRKKTDVFYQSSFDDGATWGTAVKVTTAQTDETISGADSGNQYGDYNGLSGYAGVFFPSWTDRRNLAKEEIWTAKVTDSGGGTTYSISGTITLGGAGLTGVTVTAGSGSATTSATGAYTISGLAAGSYTVTPSRSGYTFSPASASATISSANVTGINFTATAVATYSISGSAGTSGATVTAGTASATSDASNNFTIASLAAGTYTVTPTKSGCTFSPASQSVTISSANVTGVNFTASCPSGDLQLTSGVAVTGQSVAKSAWKYYYIVVPSGATNLTLATTSATGDVDIYTQSGAKPTSSSYVCRPYSSSGNETCSATNPAAATWWLGVYGYAAGSYTVTGTYTLGGTTYTVSGNAGTASATITAGTKTATSDASSNFTITGLANGTYTVTPTKSGCTFTPATRSVTVASANVTGVTFTASCGTGATLFTDGFETTGWSSVDTSGTAGTWTFATSGTHPTTMPHGGSKLAKFNSYNAASGSQTRVYRTAGFAVASSYTSVSLKFWMYHDTGYSTSNDRIQVQISTNGSTWTNVGTAISRYSATNGWVQATIDLSAYKGQTVYLGFLGISAYGNNITLDDVTVTAQ